VKMDTSIRIRTDRKHRTLYNQLRSHALGDSHELFFLCACLARKRQCPKSLGKSGEDRFWSATIEPEEWCCYYAIVLEENEMDFAQVIDDKKVIARIEEYANGGMEALIADCLKDYLAAPSGEELVIDMTAAKELPKALLAYFFEQGISEGAGGNA
jgi:hypothetical protein